MGKLAETRPRRENNDRVLQQDLVREQGARRELGEPSDRSEGGEQRSYRDRDQAGTNSVLAPRSSHPTLHICLYKRGPSPSTLAIEALFRTVARRFRKGEPCSRIS